MKRRFQHAVAHWCLKYTANLDDSAICDVAEKLNLQVDLAPMESWSAISSRGLKMSSVMADMGEGKKPYQLGFSNPAEWDFVEQRLEATINAAADQGIDRVLVFSGYKTPGVARKQAFQNVVNGFSRKTLRTAEERKVVLCFETLNSICADDAMEGHPLYLCDRTTEALQVVNALKSPYFLLATDFYHQAVMGEDSIAKVEQLQGKHGIVHTAQFGAPNRCELGNVGGRIDYPVIMKALATSGYAGRVVHEFKYSEGADYEANLSEAIRLCEASES